jgi:hypothetical protein
VAQTPKSPCTHIPPALNEVNTDTGLAFSLDSVSMEIQIETETTSRQSSPCVLTNLSTNKPPDPLLFLQTDLVRATGTRPRTLEDYGIPVASTKRSTSMLLAHVSPKPSKSPVAKKKQVKLTSFLRRTSTRVKILKRQSAQALRSQKKEENLKLPPNTRKVEASAYKVEASAYKGTLMPVAGFIKLKQSVTKVVSALRSIQWCLTL